MLHSDAIHRINKSLSRFLMYVCLPGLNSRHAKSLAFLLQLSLRARFCILVSVSSTFRQDTRSPIRKMKMVSLKDIVTGQLHAKFEYVMV